MDIGRQTLQVETMSQAVHGQDTTNLATFTSQASLPCPHKYFNRRTAFSVSDIRSTSKAPVLLIF